MPTRATVIGAIAAAAAAAVPFASSMPSTSTSTSPEELLAEPVYPTYPAGSCRDRFLWPFNSSSVWNTAIGSDAVYVPAGIYDGASPIRGPPVEFHNDQDWILRVGPDDPFVPWLDQGGFPGSCSSTGPQKATLQMPDGFVTDCVPNNNGAGVLQSDNETLIQMQPLYRGNGTGPFFAWYQRGAPQPFPWSISILGDGNLGAHGGSGLSSFGGTIRLGELLPAAPPIQHALKLELWAHAFYFFNYSSGIYDSCFTWPAVGCDSYWNVPGPGYNGTNPLLKPGALLAVPPSLAPSVRAGLTTLPGKKILDALVDFGGYIVDDTGSQEGGGAICMEHGVNAEVQSAYGYSIAIENPLKPTQGAALYNDLVAVFRALSVVANNGPATVGGGGTPRQPPPPPICGA
jgi:hypothetical protein